MTWQKNCDRITKNDIKKLLIQINNETDLKHEFSEKYQQQKVHLLRQVNEKEFIRRKHVRRLVQIATMIIAALVTIPATVYAATKLYNTYIIKEGYRTQYSIEQLHKSDKLGKIPLNLELSYLPKGMIDVEDGVKYCYKSTPYQGGFTFCLYKIKPQDEAVLTSYFSDSYENIEVNGKSGVIIHKVENVVQTGIPFDKEIYILFEDLGYILQIYIGKDVTKEEALSVANGVDLTITDKDTATFPVANQKDLPTKEDMQQKDESIIEQLASQSGSDTFTIGRDSIIMIKEPIEITPVGKKERCSYMIENIKVSDSIQGLNQSNFFDYERNIKPFIKEDGTIKGYERKWLNYGDGITSNHEVISTEYINEKYVEITVRMTNLETSTIEDIYMLPQLVFLEELENELKLCPENYSGNSFYRGFDAFVYFDQPQFTDRSERNHFFFRDIEANEELVYHLGMIVDEDLLDHMFLKMTNEDGKEIYIDIRQ